MRATLKQSILMSLLLCTSLLAAVPGNAAVLSYPHIVTSFGWQTEIAIINTTSPTQSVAGMLSAFSNQGLLVDTKAIALSARGRRQINVANEFINPATIGAIIFETNCETVQGYAKLYKDGIYRTAIPAVKEASTADIYIPHIAQDAGWTTSVSLLNATIEPKNLTITFNNGQSKSITIAAGAHTSFTIASLFNNPPPADIRSAVITNAGGIIGAVFFSNATQMDGVLLTDETASTLYYPHVVDDDVWWTGIAIYNPSASARDVTITPYNASGIPLGSFTHVIPARDRYYGTAAGLGLPGDTAWFKVDSPQPLTGLELFGTVDGQQLAAYGEVGRTGSRAGVFPKIEKNGWTGITLINTEADATSFRLIAYNDTGGVVAVYDHSSLAGYTKWTSLASAIPWDISSATYIAYSSDRNLVGYQVNGSEDGTMLDLLPALLPSASCGASSSVVISAEPTAMTTAPWTLTGPGYSQSGTGDQAVHYLTPGEYTLTWGDVPGWAKPSPPSSTQTLAVGGTIAFTGTYSAIPLIQVTPPILNFGYVPPGSYKELTLEVKNIGTATLTGMVSASSPFSIISGKDYTLGSNGTQTVVVRFTAPLPEGRQNGSLDFTGGGGITIQVTGTNKKIGLPWLMLLLE